MFLGGCDMPQTLPQAGDVTVCELGFGTGLNFLALCQMFLDHAREDQTLHYIAIEKYPLAAEDIRKALARWQQELDALLTPLLEAYPLRVPGWHERWIKDRIRLVLIFDDVESGLSDLRAPHGVDYWFLDGFAPAKNPQMWAPSLFRHMARLSHADTRLATFTVAGQVRRDLSDAGFAVEKRAGFGRKREQLSAQFSNGPARKPLFFQPKKVAVIGGGLAGTAMAYTLVRRGHHPVIFEAGDALATAASGNPAGLYNPRLQAERLPEVDFHNASWALAYHVFAGLRKMTDIGFDPCGALHLIGADERRQKKLTGALTHGWPESHMRLLSATEASEVAGITLHDDAIFLPEAGYVSPARLCHAYAQDCEVRLGHRISDLQSILESAAGDAPVKIEDEDFDAVIIAAGAALPKLQAMEGLNLHTVRGQVTMLAADVQSRQLKSNICFGGYVTPLTVDGTHICGASFQKWLSDDDPREEDDRDNISRLQDSVPGWQALKVTGHRAALRCTSPDRLPVIGALPISSRHKAETVVWENSKRVFLLGALGSHGIIGSLGGAALLAGLIDDLPAAAACGAQERLAPERFYQRARKRA